MFFGPLRKSARGHRAVPAPSHFVASMTAPVASGWSVRRVGLAPHWKAPPFHGAHPKPPSAVQFFALREPLFDHLISARSYRGAANCDLERPNVRLSIFWAGRSKYA